MATLQCTHAEARRKPPDACPACMTCLPFHASQPALNDSVKPCRAPQMCRCLSMRYGEDVVATRQRPDVQPLPPGATESFQVTKRHNSHAAAVRQWEQMVEARSKLAALWTELLLLRLSGHAGTGTGQRGG